MPFTPARKAVFFSELLRFLVDRDSAPAEEILAHLERKLHPNPEESLPNRTYGDPEWVVRIQWDSSVLTGIGWLRKDGWGTWSITPDGIQALTDYPDPNNLWIVATTAYREVLASRKPQRRAWLVRGSSVLGVNVVSDWLAQGYCSLAGSQLRPIEPGIDPEVLRAMAEEDYEHLKQHELRAKVDELVAFVTRMRRGDLVLTTSEGQVYVGDVRGDSTYERSADRRTNLRRPVTWRNPEDPVDFADLTPPLPARLQTGSTLVDLTADIDLIDSLADPVVLEEEVTAAEGMPLPADETDPSEVARPRHEHLADPSEGLAGALFVTHDWLQEVRDILDERRQVVFYGPPGTGKTYIAQALAAELVGPEQVKLVQFHPSYTYEDFFEGFRPVPGKGNGTITFDLYPGPLRRIVDRAREHPDQAFILVIDEVNRANLAKVFGELYFLLEYRDQAVDLLYSPDDKGFTLPTNLYMIGTMNTADRSIALVDAAMRRRFAFVSLHPDEEPVRSLLHKWSEHHDLGDTAARLLTELNNAIGDPDFRIGPAYFMKSKEVDAHSRERLDRIWRTSILPLLQEHHYGEWESVQAGYQIAYLLAAIGAIDGQPVPAAAETTGSESTTETGDSDTGGA